MKLTPAQHATLHVLAEFGPKVATEIQGPPGMDGKRVMRLQWNVASAPTLAALERAALVEVTRGPFWRPRNALGKPGNPRRKLFITATDAGRIAIGLRNEAAPC